MDKLIVVLAVILGLVLTAGCAEYNMYGVPLARNTYADDPCREACANAHTGNPPGCTCPATAPVPGNVTPSK